VVHIHLYFLRLAKQGVPFIKLSVWIYLIPALQLLGYSNMTETSSKNLVVSHSGEMLTSRSRL